MLFIQFAGNGGRVVVSRAAARFRDFRVFFYVILSEAKNLTADAHGDKAMRGLGCEDDFGNALARFRDLLTLAQAYGIMDEHLYKAANAIPKPIRAARAEGSLSFGGSDSGAWSILAHGGVGAAPQGRWRGSSQSPSGEWAGLLRQPLCLGCLQGLIMDLAT